ARQTSLVQAIHTLHVGGDLSKSGVWTHNRIMTARPLLGGRATLDSEPLSLSRRAAYRRVLAILGAQPSPFVIGGAIGLSLQLGRLLGCDLEIVLRVENMPGPRDGV